MIKKYGGNENNDRVYNDLLGQCTVGEIKELESLGAIIFQDVWRIRTQLKSNNSGELRTCECEAWKNYIAKRNAGSFARQEALESLGSLI